MEAIWKKLSTIRPEERKRLFEGMAMLVVTSILIAISRLEGRLFELSERLSERHDYILSVVYFGLINLNIFLILLLCFLIFRNVIKLVIERRRGVIGSKIRTKLVIALVFFALAPTAMLFYVSTRFITESFETWFSSKVEDTMVKTREAGALVYKRDKRRLESLARIALQRVNIVKLDGLGEDQSAYIKADALEGFDEEYRLSAVRVFDKSGRLIWNSDRSAQNNANSLDSFIVNAMDRFERNPGMNSRSVVEVEFGRDVVKGIAPIRNTTDATLLGVVSTEERFETQIIRSVETILREFSGLRPSAQLIKMSYTILLIVMVLVILFSATWLGFYVAREMLAPIQSLGEATHEVSLGNYSVVLKAKADDEIGQLINSFNRMIRDLKSKDEKVRGFTRQLETTNAELESRRKYMEFVLTNISAGVLAIDARERITSLNNAAERLLGISAKDAIFKPLREGLGESLYLTFWQPIIDQMDITTSSYNGQVELEEHGQQLTLLATANRIFDENRDDLGIVVVFDDASEQAQAQRVAAWREVARRIAHEIKNPITPIKLCAQRLLRRFNSHFSESDQKIFDSCIETIVSEVDVLRDLVSEFSKFARLPSVKTNLANLNDVILEAITRYQNSYPHVEFLHDRLADHLPLVPLDKEQMSRVFGNLIINAIAAIPESVSRGRIQFRTFLLNDYNTVRVEVGDNGVGIPEKLKHRVLEPYFSTKPEGTGLGLAIVNQVVTDHGGYLRIEDNSPTGTLVIIELPLGRV